MYCIVFPIVFPKVIVEYKNNWYNYELKNEKKTVIPLQNLQS